MCHTHSWPQHTWHTKICFSMTDCSWIQPMPQTPNNCVKIIHTVMNDRDHLSHNTTGHCIRCKLSPVCHQITLYSRCLIAQHHTVRVQHRTLLFMKEMTTTVRCRAERHRTVCTMWPDLFYILYCTVSCYRTACYYNDWNVLTDGK